MGLSDSRRRHVEVLEKDWRSGEGLTITNLFHLQETPIYEAPPPPPSPQPKTGFPRGRPFLPKLGISTGLRIRYDDLMGM